MKRKLVEENELPSKKIVKSNHDPCCCLLDLNYSSKLLSTKIADIPHKLKYETILAPIFEYCFGTSDQDIVWENSTKACCENDDCQIINLKIDWIRDETFINSKIFKLCENNFIILVMKFRLYNRQFILNAILHRKFRLITNCYPLLRSDFEMVMAAVKECGYSLGYASTELRNNREIVKQAVKNDGSALKYASEELQDDKEIVMIALESSTLAFVLASMRLQIDREVVFKGVSHVCNISYADKSFNNDRELILMSAKINGIETLDFACSELRNDKEIVFQAIQQDPESFKYASDELRNDREFVTEIVKKYGQCLEYSSEEFGDDKEIVELAIKSYPNAIHYISSRLRKDTEFISNIIGKKGFNYFSIEHFPNEFSNDRHIVLESIKIEPRNLTRASMDLQNDREFILQVVKKSGMAFEFINDELKSDREIIMEAITQNGDALEYVPSEYLDEEIIIKAAKTITYCIHNKFPYRLKNDREFLKKCGFWFSYFPRKYQLDREIVMEVVKTNPEDVISYAYPLIVSDRILAIRSVKKNGLLLCELPFKFRNDREIVSLAIQQNKEAFKFVSDELKNDFEILKLYNC